MLNSFSLLNHLWPYPFKIIHSVGTKMHIEFFCLIFLSPFSQSGKPKNAQFPCPNSPHFVIFFVGFFFFRFQDSYYTVFYTRVVRSFNAQKKLNWKLVMKIDTKKLLKSTLRSFEMKSENLITSRSNPCPLKCDWGLLRSVWHEHGFHSQKWSSLL